MLYDALNLIRPSSGPYEIIMYCEIHYSQADVETITKYLKEFKMSNKQPASLEQLAIKCVLENRSQFRVPMLNPLAGSNNPFEILCKFGNFDAYDMCNVTNYYQQFSARGPTEKLLAAAVDKKMNLKTEKMYLILQLLNGQVTEFDSSKMNLCDKVTSADAMIFRHMLYNCPKIRKAYIVSRIWRNFSILPRIEPQELLSVMATCWPNLTSLSLDLSFKYSEGGHGESILLSADNIIEHICTNLKNLR